MVKLIWYTLRMKRNRKIIKRRRINNWFCETLRDIVLITSVGIVTGHISYTPRHVLTVMRLIVTF